MLVVYNEFLIMTHARRPLVVQVQSTSAFTACTVGIDWLLQWSNCRATRGNGVPLPFLAGGGDAAPLVYTTAVGGRRKRPSVIRPTPQATEKMCVECM